MENKDYKIRGNVLYRITLGKEKKKKEEFRSYVRCWIFVHAHNAFNLLNTSLMLTKVNWNYTYEMTTLS